MATAETYRLCPVTGRRIYSSAEKLIKANAFVAVVFLAVGGLFGLAVALTRWQGVHLLDAEFFYLALTAHGFDVLLCWILFFEIAVLYFASAVLLNTRVAGPKFAWAGFILMVIGATMVNVVVLMGDSSVMFTAYVPMKADPNFYLGIILFAVGALIAVCCFFGTLIIAKSEKTYEGSVPLVTFGAITAAIIAVFTIVTGAIILIPTWLWSLDFISYIDTLTYKLIFWAFGHSAQQINMAAMVSIWYAIGALTVGAKPLSEKVSRSAFLLYILFLQLASAHHLLVEPALSSEWKIFNTSYAIYLAVLASMVHGLTVPGQIEVAQRAKGFNNGLFEWIRKAPWSNPAFSGMFLSLVLFGFLGGISGVVLGTEQINIMLHNTLYVPGHFHATVVAGTTLAFMAMTYALIPMIFNREIKLPGVARWQPFVFAIGVSGISVFMMGAGTLGVARRHWDINFSGADFAFSYPPAADLMLTLNGLSAILAAVGGVMFIVVVLTSIFAGKKIDAPDPSTESSPSGQVIAAYGSEHEISIPGTATLAAVFLTCFIIYYFVNWKYLSELWPMS